MGIPVVVLNYIEKGVAFIQEIAVTFADLAPIKIMASQVLANMWLVCFILVSVSSALVLKEWLEDDA